MQNFEYYPLTHPQKGIWYTEKLYPGTSIGIIAATLKIHGDIDYSSLEKAINLLIKKNDAIRIRITEKDNSPYQYITDFKYIKLDFNDFSNLNSEELFNWDKKQSEKPFELLDSDLFYFSLIKINENTGGFFIKMHHLISDAWSMSIVGNDIIEYYSLFKNNGEIDLSMKPSYIDFILKENDYYKSDRYISDTEYWKEKLKNFHGITSLKLRKSISLDSKAKRKTYILPKKLTDKLRQYCSNNKVSEYVLFFAALSMYINRVTGKEDITIGTTLLNRTNAKEKDTFGMFVSTAVPVRITIKDDMNLKMFADTISKEILSVFRHQKYPYNLLLKQVKDQDNSTNNIFDIVLTYQNSKFRNKNKEQFSTRWHFSGHQIESIIININDRDNDDKFIIDYDFLTSIFSTTEIDFIHQHIVSILWHGLDNSEKKISNLEMISENEKQKIIYDFNNTDADYPRNKTIQQLFEEQVDKTPFKIAARFGENVITYDELNKKANQLARNLRQKGISFDHVIAIMVNRSLEMIIGILGILKSGGAYLPIDPKYPAERKEFLLNNSGATVLLTKSEYLADMEFCGTVIDLYESYSYLDDASNLENINKPNDLVYVIYTSGSTGNPKGVMIEHHSLINRINWMNKKYPLDKNSVILQKTTYTFDVSVWELLWALLVGAELCFLKPDGEKDPEAIIQAMEENRVTTTHFVPSMLNVFLNYLEVTNNAYRLTSLKQIFASGEALGIQHVNKFNKLLNKTNGTELYNLYGPTEASIDVTYFDCSPEDRLLVTVPIGKPIDNTSIYILDRNKNLLPIGIAGELYIGGVGVARGYLNNEKLTKEKFVNNPFFPEKIIYRTGDLARWYPKGDIEYLGRIDSQVKIRGFRIELGEIEKKLIEHQCINEVTVIGKVKSNGENYLSAYYVSSSEIPFEELKAYLLARLPDYMVPSYFIRVDRLPVLSNGKIDKKSLPEIDLKQQFSIEYEAPKDEVETILLDIFQECLKRKDFGVNDNIFDLGGDSLTIIDILIRSYKYNWGISAADFYNNQTIRLIANKIKNGLTSEENKIELQEYLSLNQLKIVSKKKSITIMKNVFLTGATGFLGIHILKELLDRTDANIYCLVRGKDQRDAVVKLKATIENYFTSNVLNYIDNRIFVIKGDIGSNKFGLSEKTYEDLSKQIDTVIHSAALVKYFGNYSDFVNINVHGTKRIIDFSKEYNKKLYHISSLAIAGSYLTSNKVGICDFNEEDFFIGQNYKENVYVRSKFEAEMAIYDEIKYGLDVTVLRIGNLTGRALDGQFQNNIEENAFYNIIKSICQLQVIPEDQLNVDVEFTPVDLASQSIVVLMQNKNENRLVYHILNHNEVKVKNLLNIFSELGLRVSILKSSEFHNLIKIISKDKSKKNLLNGIITDISTNNLLNYSIPIKSNSKITQKSLKKQGFVWPLISNEYIKKIINHMQIVGFIDKLS